MQGWMIALIVIAAAVFVIAVGLMIGSVVATKKILGRVDTIKSKESADDYGVDSSWFDEVKSNTETVNIVAYDGNKLAALLIKHDGEDVRRVAICQHGYTATPVSVQPFAKLFYDKGFDVLLPYARAHFESEGKYIGMAWLDRFDILRWADKVVELYGRNVSIVLHGVSMGGATVVAASGMNPPPQVKCVIDDCGFASQYGEYTACIENIRLSASCFCRSQSECGCFKAIRSTTRISPSLQRNRNCRRCSFTARWTLSFRPNRVKNCTKPARPPIKIS